MLVLVLPEHTAGAVPKLSIGKGFIVTLMVEGTLGQPAAVVTKNDAVYVLDGAVPGTVMVIGEVPGRAADVTLLKIPLGVHELIVYVVGLPVTPPNGKVVLVTREHILGTVPGVIVGVGFTVSNAGFVVEVQPVLLLVTTF